MKKTHKSKNLSPTRDFSFTRYFDPQKSPHTQFHVDNNGHIVYDYIPKNRKKTGVGHLVFLAGKHGHGSYNRQKHGELK